MSISLSIPKTAEALPFDGLLTLTRTAFGLGIGMLVAESSIARRARRPRSRLSLSAHSPPFPCSSKWRWNESTAPNPIAVCVTACARSAATPVIAPKTTFTSQSRLRARRLLHRRRRSKPLRMTSRALPLLRNDLRATLRSDPERGRNSARRRRQSRAGTPAQTRPPSRARAHRAAARSRRGFFRDRSLGRLQNVQQWGNVPRPAPSPASATSPAFPA